VDPAEINAVGKPHLFAQLFRHSFPENPSTYISLKHSWCSRSFECHCKFSLCKDKGESVILPEWKTGPICARMWFCGYYFTDVSFNFFL